MSVSKDLNVDVIAVDDESRPVTVSSNVNVPDTSATIAFVKNENVGGEGDKW